MSYYNISVDQKAFFDEKIKYMIDQIELVFTAQSRRNHKNM